MEKIIGKIHKIFKRCLFIKIGNFFKSEVLFFEVTTVRIVYAMHFMNIIYGFAAIKPIQDFICTTRMAQKLRLNKYYEGVVLRPPSFYYNTLNGSQQFM